MRTITSFTATGSRGEIHTVEQWRDVVGLDNPEPLDAPRIDALCELKTSSGLILQHLSKGKYLIVETGEEITSADPDAP